MRSTVWQKYFSQIHQDVFRAIDIYQLLNGKLYNLGSLELYLNSPENTAVCMWAERSQSPHTNQSLVNISGNAT
jgi:hypothetical protein